MKLRSNSYFYSAPPVITGLVLERSDEMLLGLGCDLRFGRDRFRAALNFRNLFDVKYFEAIFAPGVTYGNAFTVQGTISWQF